jgi:hypothetical protein
VLRPLEAGEQITITIDNIPHYVTYQPGYDIADYLSEVRTLLNTFSVPFEDGPTELYFTD